MYEQSFANVTTSQSDESGVQGRHLESDHDVCHTVIQILFIFQTVESTPEVEAASKEVSNETEGDANCHSIDHFICIPCKVISSAKLISLCPTILGERPQDRHYRRLSVEGRRLWQ